MKALLLNVQDNQVSIENPSGLEDYYKLIGCSTIDITNRAIAGKRFDIICDDEGIFTENPKISAINDMGEPQLVGNLIITGEADSEGNMTDLTDEDIVHIKKNINKMGTKKYPEGYWILCQVEY